MICIFDSSSARLFPLLSLPLCLPLSICGVLDCEVLVLVLWFHISNKFTTTFANMVYFSLSIKLGNLIFLSNCRGHQLVPQGKYVHLSNCYNNHAGVSVQFLCTHTYTNMHSHNYARSAVWKVRVNVPWQCLIQLPRNILNIKDFLIDLLSSRLPLTSPWASLKINLQTIISFA